MRGRRSAYGTDGGEGSQFEDILDCGFGGIDFGGLDQGCVFDHGGRGGQGPAQPPPWM